MQKSRSARRCKCGEGNQRATTEVGAGEKLLFDRIDSDTSIFMPPENNMRSNAPCWASLPFICLAANHHRKTQTPPYMKYNLTTWYFLLIEIRPRCLE